jgi:D-sedoheptulose 7-phosphate isomerase
MSKVLHNLINKYPELKECENEIVKAFDCLKTSYQNGGKSLTCGNGGSASDSEHIVGELMKGFKQLRPLSDDLKNKYVEEFGEDGKYIADRLQGALPSIALTSNATLNTAFANDVAADLIFAQQVHGYGNSGDVVIGLSTSGNSVNVVRAMQVAKMKGVKTIGMTGSGGGKLKEICDITICVPHDCTPDIQELHLPVYHALCLMLEEEFFEN